MQTQYLDRLLLTPVRRTAILIGHMAADVRVAAALTVPILVLGVVLGVRFEGGLLHPRRHRTWHDHGTPGAKSVTLHNGAPGRSVDEPETAPDGWRLLRAAGPLSLSHASGTQLDLTGQDQQPFRQAELRTLSLQTLRPLMCPRDTRHPRKPDRRLLVSQVRGDARSMGRRYPLAGG